MTEGARQHGTRDTRIGAWSRKNQVRRTNNSDLGPPIGPFLKGTGTIEMGDPASGDEKRLQGRVSFDFNSSAAEAFLFQSL